MLKFRTPYYLPQNLEYLGFMTQEGAHFSEISFHNNIQFLSGSQGVSRLLLQFDNSIIEAYVF